MDMQWLDDVLVLLEEGNMTRAAARRNITQPAFSRRIRSFETWLGSDVLTRGTNRVEISAALHANEAEIRALVGRIRDLRTKITHFDRANATVSVAAQHAPTLSSFPDMAERAKDRLPGITFRTRAGNLRDCVSMFLRGDTSVLLCYDSDKAGPLPFGPSIRRAPWDVDDLVPLVGGPLRAVLTPEGHLPEDTPALVYPEDSYFGEVLQKGARVFGTHEFSANPVCETAFSSGIKEMILKGLGVGWLPRSMVQREIESGLLVALDGQFGKETLEVAIYGDTAHEMSMALMDVWAASAPAG